MRIRNVPSGLVQIVNSTHADPQGASLVPRATPRPSRRQPLARRYARLSSLAVKDNGGPRSRGPATMMSIDNNLLHPETKNWWIGMIKQTTGMEPVRNATLLQLGIRHAAVKLYADESEALETGKFLSSVYQTYDAVAPRSEVPFAALMYAAAQNLFSLGRHLRAAVLHFSVRDRKKRGIASWHMMIMMYRRNTKEPLCRPHFRLEIHMPLISKQLQKTSSERFSKLTIVVDGSMRVQQFRTSATGKIELGAPALTNGMPTAMHAAVEELKVKVRKAIESQTFASHLAMHSKVRQALLEHLPTSGLQDELDVHDLELRWKNDNRARYVDSIALGTGGTERRHPSRSVARAVAGSDALEGSPARGKRTTTSMRTNGVKLVLSEEGMQKLGQNITPAHFTDFYIRQGSGQSFDTVAAYLKEFCHNADASGVRLLALAASSLSRRFPGVRAGIHITEKGSDQNHVTVVVRVNKGHPLCEEEPAFVSLLFHVRQCADQQSYIVRVDGKEHSIQEWRIALFVRDRECTILEGDEEKDKSSTLRSFAEAVGSTSSAVIGRLLEEINFDAWPSVLQLLAEALLQVLRLPEQTLKLLAVSVQAITAPGSDVPDLTAITGWTSDGQRTCREPEIGRISEHQDVEIFNTSSAAEDVPDEAIQQAKQAVGGSGTTRSDHASWTSSTFTSGVLREISGFDYLQIGKSSEGTYDELLEVATPIVARIEKSLRGSQRRGVFAIADALREYLDSPETLGTTVIARHKTLAKDHPFVTGESLQLASISSGRVSLALPAIPELPFQVDSVDSSPARVVHFNVTLKGVLATSQPEQPAALPDQITFVASALVAVAKSLAARTHFKDLKAAAAGYGDEILSDREKFAKVMFIEAVSVKAVSRLYSGSEHLEKASSQATLRSADFKADMREAIMSDDMTSDRNNIRAGTTDEEYIGEAVGQLEDAKQDDKTAAAEEHQTVEASDTVASSDDAHPDVANDENPSTDANGAKVNPVQKDKSAGGVYIALGSNMGNRLRNIETACNLIDADPDMKLVKTSSLYDTEPMYVENQDRFLNGACEIATSLEPLVLLDRLQAIEEKLGRVRTIDKGPRTIDLDILLYRDLQMHHQRLTIPHPLMHEREFVLRPLNNIYGGRVPGIRRHPSDLLSQLTLAQPQTSENGSTKLLPQACLAPHLPLLQLPGMDMPTRIMSILNTTPDSFSDGGVQPVGDPQGLQQVVESHIEAGATIIDVGGQSSRPGAPDVTAEEEIARILPAIEAIKASRFPDRVAISVDTYRAAVAEAAVKAGAHIVNDISGGMLDPNMLATVARIGCTYVIMHMRGTPATMQNPENCIYPEDVLAGVRDELWQRIAAAEGAGIRPWRIIVDPGIGFSKTADQNVELLRRTLNLRQSFHRYPFLVGSSRKSFIGKITGVQDPAERQWGTAATVAMAVSRGANIVRVHDVAEMAQVARMADAMRHAAKPNPAVRGVMSNSAHHCVH